MKITIITAVFNRVDTIASAIESVLSQKDVDLEYIVVDAASTDGTTDVIRRYADRIDRFISEPDKGMYEGINKGLRAATGDVVGLLHSDDVLYDETTLHDVVAQLETTGADFLYGDGYFVRATDLSRVIRYWRGGSFRRWKVRHGWLPLHTTCYVRREMLERCGLYDEKYKIAADTDWLLRYLLNGTPAVTYLPRVLVKMRMGGLSTSRSLMRKMWREDTQIYAAYGFWPVCAKIQKMCWKLPQFLRARFC